MTMIDRSDIEAKLDDLSNLTPGWDGYRAGPISAECVRAARVVAYALADAGRHISIVPTSAETLAIEWMDGDMECVAEIDATRELEYRLN